jgi:hypothetical protein
VNKAGTQCTCFTGTTVQKLTQEGSRGAGLAEKRGLVVNDVDTELLRLKGVEGEVLLALNIRAECRV